mmetsp:Transcript_44322/g.96172  ORF Transcript_44322/g.96172 Transcript_44322/m.96172 type:complete len:364 (-) Transcript_44322:66-1157(-)
MELPDSESTDGLASSSLTGRSLALFLQQADTSSTKRPQDYVTITTVHQAKGLEFRHVFLVCFNEGIMPLLVVHEQPRPDDCIEDEEGAKEAQEAQEALAEERRVAFVALTRAKWQLHISWSSRFPNGERLFPSRFLDELPIEFTERGMSGNLQMAQPSMPHGQDKEAPSTVLCNSNARIATSPVVPSSVSLQSNLPQTAQGTQSAVQPSPGTALRTPATLSRPAVWSPLQSQQPCVSRNPPAANRTASAQRPVAVSVPVQRSRHAPAQPADPAGPSAVRTQPSKAQYPTLGKRRMCDAPHPDGALQRNDTTSLQPKGTPKQAKGAERGNGDPALTEDRQVTKPRRSALGFNWRQNRVLSLTKN